VAAGAGPKPVVIDEAAVREALGRPKVFREVAARTATPGVATGLAVTGTGGDVLFVEAATMTGKGGLVLTGQLGDVMKESARIALTYVRSHAAGLGIKDETFAGKEFHLHVPAGAVPKDGPSAGVTLVTAVASLMTGRPVKSTIGMTGEVTLQGRVLPIGGVKQKVLAAHAAGLTEVILPKRNEPDLDDVPKDVRNHMRFDASSTSFSIPRSRCAASDVGVSTVFLDLSLRVIQASTSRRASGVPPDCPVERSPQTLAVSLVPCVGNRMPPFGACPTRTRDTSLVSPPTRRTPRSSAGISIAIQSGAEQDSTQDP
jgi:hypothetical protein